MFIGWGVGVGAQHVQGKERGSPLPTVQSGCDSAINAHLLLHRLQPTALPTFPVTTKTKRPLPVCGKGCVEQAGSAAG